MIKDRVSVCTVMVLCFLANGFLLGNAAEEKLENDVKSLLARVDAMINTSTVMDQKLTYVNGKLEIPAKMASDLNKLTEIMDTAKLLLEVAEAIPDLEKPASLVRKGVSVIESPISEAKSGLTTIDDYLKPIKTAGNDFQKLNQKVLSALKSFKNGLNQYVAKISQAQGCISSLPNGSKKSQLQSSLDKLAKASDTRVVQLNTFITKAESAYNSIIKVVNTKIGKLFSSLYAIEKAIESLDKYFDDIIDPLRDVGSLLKKYFKVKFPYPHPELSNPLHFSHYTLRISMSYIVKGAHEIEKKIEHILSSALYKAAKVFGLSKLVKSLEKLADKELKKIMGKLHLNFKVHIDGLDKLSSLLSQIKETLSDWIKGFRFDIDGLTKMIKAIEADISAIEKIYENCK